MNPSLFEPGVDFLMFLFSKDPMSVLPTYHGLNQVEAPAAPSIIISQIKDATDAMTKSMEATVCHSGDKLI